MQISLQAVSPADIDTIDIDDELFPIGRSDPPFNTMSPDYVSQLSRRHARIFEEQGKLYLVDLGSRNGTRLNGRKVAGQPERLKHQDEIMFGNLVFQLADHADPTEQTTPPQASLHLSLSPQSNAKPASILITEFPCLVSKNSGFIAQYCEHGGTDPQFLSRRHAHFFIAKGGLWLEDLASTNGSWVNEERLQDQARLLTDGDKIRFGSGDGLSFRIGIEQFQGDDGDTEYLSATGTQTTGEASEGPHTILMDKASNFLDIFCEEALEDTPPEQGDVNDSAEHPEPVKKPAAWRTGFHLLFHNADGSPRSGPLSFKAVVTTIVVVTALVAGLTLYQSANPLNKAQSYYDKGQFQEAARIAGAALADKPDSSALQRLSTAACINWLAPPWLTAMHNGDYNNARQQLTRLGDIAASNADVVAAVALLGWATDMEELIARMENGQAVEIYGNEAHIQATIDGWERDPQLNQHYLGLLVQQYPDFEGYQATLLSHLRQLKNSQSVYLGAIERLKQGIDDALREDDIAQIEQLLQTFEEKYPDIHGLERLRQDSSTYEKLVRAKSENRLMDLVVLQGQQPLSTPLFRRHAAQNIEAELPPAEIVERYTLAEQAWRDGDLVVAIKTSSELVEEPWGEVAAQKLERYDSVISGYETLLASEGGEHYIDNLLSFYTQLDPDQDQFFVAQLQPQFIEMRDQALAQAKLSMQEAQQLWQDYQARGGISSSLRLENSVSRDYRKQCTALAQAFAGIRASHLTRNLLGALVTADDTALSQQVITEVVHQRSGIEELREALGDSLAQQKLALLPYPDLK